MREGAEKCEISYRGGVKMGRKEIESEKNRKVLIALSISRIMFIFGVIRNFRQISLQFVILCYLIIYIAIDKVPPTSTHSHIAKENWQFFFKKMYHQSMVGQSMMWRQLRPLAVSSFVSLNAYTCCKTSFSVNIFPQLNTQSTRRFSVLFTCV